MLASSSQPPGMMSYAADTLQRFALCLRLCDLNFVVSLEFFFSFLSCFFYYYTLFCYVFELRFATPFVVSGPIDLLALLFAIRMSWLQSCLSGLSGRARAREREITRSLHCANSSSAKSLTRLKSNFQCSAQFLS